MSNNRTKTEALIEAARWGDLHCVNVLIRAVADVNSSVDGQTALTEAAKNGRDKCLSALIKAGAFTNIPDGYHNVALIHAIKKESVKCVEILLKDEANVNVCQTNWVGKMIPGRGFVKVGIDNNETALMCAVRTKNMCSGLVDAVLKGHHLCVEQRAQKEEDDPFNCEVKYNIIKLLIEKEADVNASTKEGSTVLMEATPDHKCVELLLKAGARDRAEGNSNLSVVPTAAQYGYIKSLELLIQAGDVNPAYKNSTSIALMKAAQNGCNTCVERLIHAGADVNVPDKDGCTALIHAVKHGQSKCARLLLQAGADVNATDNRRKDTALKYAIHGYTGNGFTNGGTVLNMKCYTAAECVTLLINAGADVNTTNEKEGVLSAIILRSTCFKGCECKDHSVDQYSLVRLFLNAGVDLNKTVGGKTILRRLTASRKDIPQDISMLILATGVSERSLQQNKFHLMSLCRSTIREHLLNIDPHTNLFISVPRLGLPSVLTNYLLFYTFLTKKKMPCESQ